MSQRSQRERIFVEAPGVAQHNTDKIPAADVVNEVGKEVRPEWVVPHVLNDASAVSVGASLLQIGRAGARKTLQQEGLDGFLPDGVNDGFMRENGIGVKIWRMQADDEEQTSQIPHITMLPRVPSEMSNGGFTLSFPAGRTNIFEHPSPEPLEQKRILVANV